jgi:hypothetical protein
MANMGERLVVAPSLNAAATNTATSEHPDLCFAVRAPDSVIGGRRPPKVLWRLLRDGQIIGAGTGERFSALFAAPPAGAGTAYRVEGYRYAWRLGPFFAGVRPWLFSNPIYVKATAAPDPKSGKNGVSNTRDRNCSPVADVYEPVLAPTRATAAPALRRR